MNISVEWILGLIGVVLIILSGKEYLSNGHKITPKIKAWVRVSAIFCVVIVFNLYITNN